MVKRAAPDASIERRTSRRISAIPKPAQDSEEEKRPAKRARRSVSTEPSAAKAKPRTKVVKAPRVGINPFAKLSPYPTAAFTFDLSPPSNNAPALLTFGTGEFGQFGLGPDVLASIKRPRIHAAFNKLAEEGKLGPNGGISDVDCGGLHTLAVDTEGKVWSYGINDSGALGRITLGVEGQDQEELEMYPGLVQGLKKEDFKAAKVYAGDSVSVAISENGDLKVWGSFRGNEGRIGFDGKVGSPEVEFNPMTPDNLRNVHFTEAAVGQNHVLALDTDGHIWVWGSGQQSQLGRKILARRIANGLLPDKLALRNATHVGAGAFHSFAVDKDGSVYAWGLNSFGQCGLTNKDGTFEDIITNPREVKALHPNNNDGKTVVQVAGGEHHSIFLFSDGSVSGCGRNDSSQIGLGDDHELVVAAKKAHSEGKAALDAMLVQVQAEIAELRKKGEGEYEDMSDEDAAVKAGEIAGSRVDVPQPLINTPASIKFPDEGADPDRGLEAGPAKIVQIAAGTRNNLAISARGYVYSWGLGINDQLGQGGEDEIETPTRIVNTVTKANRILKASAGGQHCALLSVSLVEAPPAPTAPAEPESKTDATESNGLSEVKENGAVETTFRS